MRTPWATRGAIWRSSALLLASLLTGCTSLPQRCPASDSAESLMGAWTVQLGGTHNIWSLQLTPHPEHTGSWRGQLIQGAQRFAVVADLDEGEFTMEESHDGLRIAATWLGTALPGPCSPTIQGQRIETNQNPLSFTMQLAEQERKK
jgi:hypothetical protein